MPIRCFLIVVGSGDAWIENHLLYAGALTADLKVLRLSAFDRLMSARSLSGSDFSAAPGTEQMDTYLAR